MNLAERTVALVGRPNVGKSRLFNALARRRIAIVHDQPGVTRDVNYADIAEGHYTLLDTGGLGITEQMQETALTQAVEDQVYLAVEAASLVLFVVDAREGMTALDEIVAERLRRFAARVQIVVNKVDRPEDEGRVASFRKLGLGQALGVSAEHGRNLDALRETIEERLGPAPDQLAKGAEAIRRTRLCLAGRPNVGKSSIANRLLAAQRLVVSEIAGTTRDSVELALDYPDPDSGEVHRFSLIDTAGLRRRGRIGTPVEFFSAVRTEHAVESADVVILIVDARDGPTTQDKSIAGRALEAGRALIVVVNKWDLAVKAVEAGDLKGYDTVEEFQRDFFGALDQTLFFAPGSPVLFLSALEGFPVGELLKEARQLDERQDQKLPTGLLNRFLHDRVEKRPPSIRGGKRFKVFYAVQTGNRPITLRLFCNEATSLDESYKRYLENGLREVFDLNGCPLRLRFVGKERRFQPGPGEAPARKKRSRSDRASGARKTGGRSPVKRHQGGTRKPRRP